jgi:5-formyltetrahydrofolate cyclo-ligase
MLLGYLALKNEINLRPAFASAESEGRTVALPRYVLEEGLYCAAVPERGAALVEGAFGISEPGPEATVFPLNQLDLVLVPGLAFDPRGRRLGRGKGFYDRLLAQVSGVKCGVALDEQILEELPAEPHDIIMDYILTPTRWLAIQSAPAAGT